MNATAPPKFRTWLNILDYHLIVYSIPPEKLDIERKKSMISIYFFWGCFL